VGITEAIGTHTLRKTFGYWAYKDGKDLSLIQKLLNHASPAVTLAYIGITQDELDDVYLGKRQITPTLALSARWGFNVIYD